MLPKQPQPKDSALHILTADEWAVIQAYRGCSAEYRTNIAIFAAETFSIYLASLPGNVVPLVT